MKKDSALEPKIINKISDSDRDSLWSLPLLMIPLQSDALKRTRIVKNNHLEGVIELFADEDTGTGYVSPDHIHNFFSNIPDSDINVIRKLSKLKSYDVYSLRISLRQNGINVEDYDDLKLSEKIQIELQDYMKPFLTNLVVNIFDPEDISNFDFENDNWLNIFYNPDIQKARKQLNNMAGKLNIRLQELPSVLQKYGDVYLSVAYYRRCLNDINPLISDFMNATVQIKSHQQLRNDYILVSACNRLHNKISRMQSMLTGQFDAFDVSSANMWNDISPDNFMKFKNTVESNHSTIGALLCALAVKMDHWSKKFPNPDLGGPVQRADFIVNDMAQGL